MEHLFAFRQQQQMQLNAVVQQLIVCVAEVTNVALQEIFAHQYQGIFKILDAQMDAVLDLINRFVPRQQQGME